MGGGKFKYINVIRIYNSEARSRFFTVPALIVFQVYLSVFLYSFICAYLYMCITYSLCTQLGGDVALYAHALRALVRQRLLPPESGQYSFSFQREESLARYLATLHGIHALENGLNRRIPLGGGGERERLWLIRFKL